MGKPDGFLEFERKTAPYRPVSERVRDYKEVELHLCNDDLVTQAARCMDCGIPYCHALGCPVFNLIPEWNDLVYNQQWYEAFWRLESTNNFPEITGKVCPAPCEQSCTLSINSAPVTIRQIESAVIDRAWKEGWVNPLPPSYQTIAHIAVVGSGPAGLAAAQQLRRAGHQVTVYEKSRKPGGILRYGIPDFKLQKSFIDRRIAQMEAEGVKFECEVTIGEDISIQYLRRKNHAVILAVGAGEPRDLHVPGRGYEGIHFAMDYLTQSNKFVSGEIRREEMLWAGGKDVLIIGGGDTGSDCAGTAIRQGAASVHLLEILPEPQEWKQPWNPQWPYRPDILRTSSSHQEGCRRKWAVVTKRFVGHDERVKEAVCARVQWKRKGAETVPVEIDGSEFTIKADMVLLSTGFLHVQHDSILRNIGIVLDKKGNINTDQNYLTSVPGVFAVGDAVSGASLVVSAIYSGRRAAECIDRYLKQESMQRNK